MSDRIELKSIDDEGTFKRNFSVKELVVPMMRYAYHAGFMLSKDGFNGEMCEDESDEDIMRGLEEDFDKFVESYFKKESK